MAGRRRPAPSRGGARPRPPQARPARLPPRIDLGPLAGLLSEAAHAVGTLNGLCGRIASPHMLLRPLLVREAVQSSRLSGSDVTVDRFYRHQLLGRGYGERPSVDVDAGNCADAMSSGLAAVAGGADVGASLLSDCNGILLHGPAWSGFRRGELREAQPRRGPPSPGAVPRQMAALDAFMSGAGAGLPPLVQCAVAHYQLAAVRPYAAGNGRMARMLVPLMLSDRRLLGAPLLYLSGYFERHEPEYRGLLARAALPGGWAPWVRFFLRAAAEQASEAAALLSRLDAARSEFRARAKAARVSPHTARAAELLLESPVLSRRVVCDKLGVSDITAASALERLDRMGLAREAGIYKSRKIYASQDLLDLFEPPAGGAAAGAAARPSRR